MFYKHHSSLLLLILMVMINVIHFVKRNQEDPGTVFNKLFYKYLY